MIFEHKSVRPSKAFSASGAHISPLAQDKLDRSAKRLTVLDHLRSIVVDLGGLFVTAGAINHFSLQLYVYPLFFLEIFDFFHLNILQIRQL